MILEHRGKRPRIHASAYVAPNATLCGDVTIGAESRVLFGAVLTAESGPVTLGERCIIMENAVIRGVAHHPASLGDHVLVGPHAHLSGCRVEDDVFVATGACIFNGATIGARATVRIRGIVHIRTRIPPDAVVPIGWVALLAQGSRGDLEAARRARLRAHRVRRPAGGARRDAHARAKPALHARARRAQGRPHCRALSPASSRARSSSPASTAGSASRRVRPTSSSAWRPTRRAAAST